MLMSVVMKSEIRKTTALLPDNMGTEPAAISEMPGLLFNAVFIEPDSHSPQIQSVKDASRRM